MANSKRKGDAAERELLEVLTSSGIPAERHQQGLLADFKGGHGNPDISATVAGHPLHIEVKRTERLRLSEAMRQAKRDAVNAIPAVVHRANRQPWVISLELSEFLAIFAGNKARQNRDKSMTAFGSNDE